MRYLSVCSGIEAASVAWHHLGWQPVGFSEIEPFPAAVLAHRFPNIPNYGDMTQHESWPITRGSIDLLVGGTPCQSFSVAGLRQGLADPRGNLMLTYLAIADRLRPRWLVWENVPGVLSSNGGRDFGTFLGSLGELGYGWAYRVLDAQYIRVGRWPRAVPQRRRRVFVVGRLIERGARDWAAPGEVLALAEGLQRHLEARRAKGKGTPSDAEGGVGVGCCGTVSSKWAKGTGGPAGDECYNLIAQPTAYRWQNDRDGLQQDDAVAAPRASQGASGFHEMNHPVIAQPVPYDLFQITAPVNRQNRAPGDPCHTLAKDNAAHAAVAFHPTQDPISSTDGSTHCMGTGSSRGDATIAVATSFIPGNSAAARSMGETEECCVTIKGDGGGSKPHVQYDMTVRRLSPMECERLQGFPLSWQIVTIEACFDHHQGHVHAVVSCRSALGNASPAVEKQRWQHVPTAPSNSLTSQAKHESLAALSVLTSYEAELLEIRSLGKLLWSANGAARPNSYRLSMPAASIARELAQHAQELVQAIQDGKAGSRLSMTLSIPAKSGNKPVKRCGDAILENVADVLSDHAPDTFTTSDLGQLRPTSDSASTTSCCSVFHAIAGCIPSAIIPNSFSVEIAVGTPWTMIPYRGKPPEQCPDGPRYKALGNSMACNCMAWIGERIAAYENQNP